MAVPCAEYQQQSLNWDHQWRQRNRQFADRCAELSGCAPIDFRLRLSLEELCRICSERLESASKPHTESGHPVFTADAESGKAQYAGPFPSRSGTAISVDRRPTSYTRNELGSAGGSRNSGFSANHGSDSSLCLCWSWRPLPIS